jgi:hypothetical protein
MPSPSQRPRLPPVLERKVDRLKGTNVVVITCNVMQVVSKYNRKIG